ncbi:MAG: extracellular solute-binding protein [Spirochaetales bacterium]|nr:extracellular solute-binding protein [Spirochaetales bacterium]
MKKSLCLLIVLLLAFTNLTANGNKEAGASDAANQSVELIMGSWRTDDAEQMKAVLGEFTKKYPNIKVKFQPTIPAEYNSTLRLQLEGGIGPDVMYARSFATGIQLFNDGYFADVSNVLGYNENYSDSNKSPWMTKDGVPFAIPFAAVSHGIYYNKEIFKELGLTKPKNWDDFLSYCQKIKDAGYIPLANGLADEWDITEVVFMNIAPNFIGGMEGRLAYDSGKKKFNGPEVVKLFEAMASLKPYLPSGYEAISYNDSNALFATGQAAMYFDGSWTIGTFADVDFEWGILPPPAPAGSKSEYITFHADAGMAMNTSTKHPNEVKTLLSWFGSSDGAAALAKYLPTGFFPMSENSVVIQDSHANEFLNLNKGRGTDVRWAWPELLAGEPSGYTLMQEGSIGVITGYLTPQEAADQFRAGLAEWYTPAK